MDDPGPVPPTLETGRLILRAWREDDLDAVQAYAGILDNVFFMPWGPNSKEDSLLFLRRSIGQYRTEPMCGYAYGVVLKKTGRLIGGCEISVRPGEKEAALGWILHRDHWKQGYGTELAHELLRFGFDDLLLHRIFATCDSLNTGSYRVMERNHMRREGYFIGNRLIRGQWRDEFLYAMLDEDWEVRKEIDQYNALPVSFEGFIDLPALSDGVVELICREKKPAVPEIGHVPAYGFDIYVRGVRAGTIGLRIGYTDGLYYGGQIGYAVDEEHRGHSYAAKACRLLAPVIRAHGMDRVLITTDPGNAPSRRTCEKIGACPVRTARLPDWHDLYREGHRSVSIYEWDLK